MPNHSIEFMLAFGKHRTSLRDAAHFKLQGLPQIFNRRCVFLSSLHPRLI